MNKSYEQKPSSNINRAFVHCYLVFNKTLAQKHNLYIVHEMFLFYFCVHFSVF